jgi:hypothetical protein
MSAVAYQARVQLRRRLPTVAVIAIVVTVAGTVTLATAAGARRTSGVLDRFVAETQPIDVFVFSPEPIGDDTFEQLAAIDGVRDIGRIDVPAMVLPGSENDIVFVGLVDGYGAMSKSPRLLEGRRADPDAPLEIAPHEAAARDLGVGLGDTVETIAFAPDQLPQLRQGEDVEPAGPRYRLEVVGITRDGVDFAVSGEPSFPDLTPAFLRQHGDETAHFIFGLVASLDGGAEAEAAFFRAAQPLLGPESEFDGSAGDFGGLFDTASVMATALWLASAVAAVAGLAVFVVVVGRVARVIGRDDLTLRALGLSRPQRVATTIGVVGAGVALGAVGAVGGAIAASRWFPTGLLRRAEPDLGIDVDPLVLGVGGPLLLVVLLTATAVVAWRSGRAVTGTAGMPSTAPMTVVLARLRAPVQLIVGADMALRRGLDRRAPNMGAVIGATVAAAGVVAALTFATSLDRLLAQPARWGWGWDLSIEADRAVSDRLVASDEVEAVGVGRFVVEVEVGGRRVNAQGIESRKGGLAPTVAAGRAPAAPDEVALGAETLEALGVDVGDTVSATCIDRPCELRVVGQALMFNPSETVPVAEGAALTLDGLERLTESDANAVDDAPEALLVRWAPGVDGGAAARRLELPNGLDGSQPPSDIARIDEAAGIPWLLTAFVVIIGLTALGYALITGLQARRRDLGVLRAVGFLRRQVATAIGWQATIVVGLALLIGVPLGFVVGRWTWRVVAESLGVAPDIRLPLLAVGLLVVAALALANVVAVGPAWSAGRRSPAEALRSE